jgi:hypothetical protein
MRTSSSEFLDRTRRNMRRFRTLLLLVTLTITAQTVPAANITFYGTRADWNAAVGVNTVIDFDGLEPPGGYSGISVPPGLTLSGVNFSTTLPTTGSDFILAGPVNYGPSSVLALYDSSTAARTLVINFPGAGFLGIAFDLGRTVIPRNVIVQLSTGDSFVTAASFPPSFVGFTSSAPITQVTITEAQGTNVLLLDNVSFALPPQPPIQGSTTGVPTLTDSMLICLAAVLAVTGGVLMRRQYWAIRR